MSLKKIAANASEEFLIWIVENYYDDIRINLKEIGEYICESDSPFEIFAYAAMRGRDRLWDVLVGSCNRFIVHHDGNPAGLVVKKV